MLIRSQRSCAFAVAALILVSAPAKLRAADSSDISVFDLVELDMGYTTLSDNFYQRVEPQRLLDGARVGLIAYLRSRNVSDPHIPLLRTSRDGRGVVPLIEQQIGRAIVRFHSRVTARGLIYGAIRGEVGALNDAYSIFLTKAEVAKFTTALDGRSFAGIGAVIVGDANGNFRIDRVFDGSPAQQAGIQNGDRVVAIDGQPVANGTLQSIAGRLHGPTGTKVTLRIEPVDQTGALREIAIVRAAITPPDTTIRMLPHAIGYVGLRTFGPAAGAQVHSALSRLHAQGARGIVFDLRGNGGGYERSAEGVASAFVANGPIVAIASNSGPRRVSLADGSALPALPLVVLVDGDSASGSELVTGAIADHRLGTIVGTQTFGKGLVQSMFPLPDGAALKVTTARYFTPNGSSIDRIGIRPDIVVAEPADAQHGVPGRDPQLDAGLRYLTAQL